MRLRTTSAALAITSLLALPAGALAGGWATVGLSSTPDGLAPGATWDVELEILQHGRRPLDGLHPAVRISGGATTSRTFRATPAGTPGTYRASVTFPRAGTWRYVVDDGFTATHTYPAVRIAAGLQAGGAAAPAGTGADGDEVAWGRLALATLAGLAAAALARGLPGGLRARRRRDAAPSGV